MMVSIKMVGVMMENWIINQLNCAKKKLVYIARTNTNTNCENVFIQIFTITQSNEFQFLPTTPKPMGDIKITSFACIALYPKGKLSLMYLDSSHLQEFNFDKVLKVCTKSKLLIGITNNSFLSYTKELHSRIMFEDRNFQH